MNPSVVLAFLGLSIAATGAWALSSDRDQPIVIEAERVDIDERQGVSTYSGNVSVVQGSTRIRADRVEVFTEDRRLEKVTAVGEPAHYRQQPEASEEEVIAEAQRIEYTSEDGVLVLLGAAELRQAGSRFQGSRIEYDTRQEIVRARGGGEDDERVRVIIQPEQARERIEGDK